MRILARGVAVLLAVVIVAAFAERVLAQGYEGLMAPAPSETTSDRPPGYEGVMPGWIAPPQAANTVTVPAVKSSPAQTPVLGQAMNQQSPSDEIRTLSMIRGLDIDMNRVPDTLEGNIVRLPAASIEALSRPRTRMNGMLSMETSIRNSVNQIMSSVKGGKLSEEQARDAYKQLDDLRAGLKFKSQIPESVYQKMGLPDIYIKEEKGGISSTLAFVEEAMAELNGYQ